MIPSIGNSAPARKRRRSVASMQDPDLILLVAQRYRRSAELQSRWAEIATKCVNYFEGRQWSDADLAKLRSQKRPALVINKIRPLVNLVMGYFLTKRTDIRYVPGTDGSGTAEIANALTHVVKSISQSNLLPYIDSEVFLDGILTGRGYYDARLSYDNNLMGEVSVKALDPFTVYPDSDGQDYDCNQWGHCTISRMISLDEVLFNYGKDVADRVSPLINGQARVGHQITGEPFLDEITPPRRFSEESDGQLADLFYDYVDSYRKSIRLLDHQHYVSIRRWFIVDMEAGDRRPVPDHWTADQRQKLLDWAAAEHQPVAIALLPCRRLRWTHMIGDVVAYDGWSPYESMTVTPFFPYWRRGMTQGMVESLLDSQDEINKRRSARLNIVGRASSGGWMFPKGCLDPMQKENLQRFGSTPGVQIEYEPGRNMDWKPEPISPGVPPMAMAQLEHESEADLKDISGINAAALGQLEQSALSGRAILARQRQAVVGLEFLVANYGRTKRLQGAKLQQMVQNHYTEQRTIRTVGEGTSQISTVINQRSAMGIRNDVALGTYTAMIDDRPLTDDFLAAQFEEMLKLKQLGMPIPDEFLIDASTFPRKEELKDALQAQRQQEEAMLQAGMVPSHQAAGGGANHPPARKPKGLGPGGSLTGPDGGSISGDSEPGRPISGG